MAVKIDRERIQGSSNSSSLSKKKKNTEINLNGLLNEELSL